jgi:hypothetical protein
MSGDVFDRPLPDCPDSAGWAGEPLIAAVGDTTVDAIRRRANGHGRCLIAINEPAGGGRVFVWWEPVQ